MTTQQDVKGLFLKKKPTQILVSMKKGNEHYALKLSRIADTTYSHTVKTLQKMEDLGLVEFERDGRRKMVYLTRFGNMLAEDLINFHQKAEYR